MRCQQAAREARDAAVDKLRDKYEVQAQAHRGQAGAASSATWKTASASTRAGRPRRSSPASPHWPVRWASSGGRRRSLRGLSTAATKRRMTSSAKADIAESEAEIARLQARLDDLKSQMEDDADELTKQWDAAAADIQTIKIAPRKTDVDVQLVALAWAPTWEITYEDARGRAGPMPCPHTRGRAAGEDRRLI